MMVHSVAIRALRQSNSRALARVMKEQRQLSGFSFAGPKQLNDVLKVDMVKDKSANEIAEIWYEFHDEKQGVLGMVMKGQQGKEILERARECPFFIQPVFRDDGFFMLMSQYMDPSHFCMAYLEDYKMDPHSATPLLTFSVFNDFATSKNLTLIRCDVLNKGIADYEGEKIVTSALNNYNHGFDTIKTFNNDPQNFDIDDFISRMSAQWKETEGLSGTTLMNEK